MRAGQPRASTRTEQQTAQQEEAVAEQPQQKLQHLPAFIPQQVQQVMQPALPAIRSIAKAINSVDPRIR
jgi:hypothetical protein